jgi:hypothetical protein
VALAAAEPVNPAALAYLNRLSDYCFVLARAQQGRRSALGSGRQPLLIGLDQPGLIFGLRPPATGCKGKGEGMETVAVIGAGQMGAGIAQVMAQAGLAVLLADVDLDAATKGRDGSARRWRVWSPRTR